MQEITLQLVTIFGVLFCTSFTKVFTILTLFRFGIGIKGQGFGIILFGLSLVLAISNFNSYNSNLQNSLAIPDKVNQTSNLSLEELFKNSQQSNSLQSIEDKFGKYVNDKVDKQVLEKIKQNNTPSQTENTITATTSDKTKTNFLATLTAFQVGQLKTGFLVGLMILIPFVLIDLLVANIITAIGIKELSAETVSLVLKIILFMTVGGWELLSNKIITSL